MSKYHAAAKGTNPGVGGFPLCGSGQTKDRLKTHTISAKSWNSLENPEQRCERCVEAIRKAKERMSRS